MRQWLLVSLASSEVKKCDGNDAMVCLTLVSIRVTALALHTDMEFINKTTRSLAHIFYHYDCYFILESIRGYSSLFFFLCASTPLTS